MSPRRRRGAVRPRFPAAARADGGVRVTLARGAGALELLDERWDGLLARQPLPNPLQSSTWLRALARWEHGPPLVAVAEDGGTLVAAAALELARPGGRLGPRLGVWLGPPEQQCSFDLLVDPGREQAGAALAAALLEEVDALSLATPASGAAARALAAAAPWHRSRPSAERWRLACPPPRLDYARRQAEADRRRAERLGVATAVRVAWSPDELRALLARLFRLHRERWSGRPEAAVRVATTRVHRRWTAGAFLAMAALGSAVGVEVLEDGRTVAASLGLLHGHGGFAHTTAMRTGGALRQPGHLAALARAEAMLAAGVAEIDLGSGGGEPGGPKARLGPSSEPLVLLFAAGSAARQRRYEALRRLRRVVRPT